MYVIVLQSKLFLYNCFWWMCSNIHFISWVLFYIRIHTGKRPWTILYK